MHAVLGSSPHPISDSRSEAVEQKVQKSKVIFNYIASLSPAWAM